MQKHGKLDKRSQKANGLASYNTYVSLYNNTILYEIK